MRYLTLENHIIPVLNISRVEREYEDGTGEDEGLMFEKVTIWMKDGSSIEPTEEFDKIRDALFRS